MIKKRLTLGIHLFRTNYYHQELKRKKEYHLVGYKRTKNKNKNDFFFDSMYYYIIIIINRFSL